MNIDSFFTDHWQTIEEERVQRYEQMFVWHDAQKKLLEPAQLGAGQVVLDIGAGPGFFAGGLAEIVTPSGQVHGVDINQRFVDDANQRFAQTDNVQFHKVDDHRLPFADATFDRVICKNVLEYVPDIVSTLGEVLRVLKPGGLVHVIDSDWGFVIVQPWSPETVSKFFRAASPAFNEPLIGRRVPGLLTRSGFSEVKVGLSPFVDQAGRGLHVLNNMASYIATFNTMPEQEVRALIGEVEEALAKNEFLFCLPQFLITASKA